MIIGPSSDPWISGFGSIGSAIESSNPKRVAQSFESLILRQLLNSLRSTGISEQQDAESGWIAMADDAMASYLSKAGGLGLAKSVESLLTQAKANKS